MMTREQAEERVAVGLWIHLAAYVAVNTGLAALNFSRNPDNLWFLWVVGGWGIGIAAHAAAYFIPEGRERMIERTTARVERRQQRQASRRDTTDMTERMSQANR